MAATTTTEEPIGDVRYDLESFVSDVERVLDPHPAMPILIKDVSRLLYRLCRDGSWLAPENRVGRDDSYARHLLHKDPQNRFVVLSLIWRPGQGTPIHDHSCWGVMGVMENALEETIYERLDDGSRPDYAEIRETQGGQVSAGSTSYLLPPYHEIHAIGNTGDRDAVSIHVYGRDIDEVNVFEPSSNSVRKMRIKYYQPECGGSDFVI
jgi:predicted metal-dependent enzyme (double-stranded beta helix superfamily)